MTASVLPPSVTAYFERADAPDPSSVADLFTADAVVLDDGHTYRGRAEILGWLTGPASAFTTTSTWLSAESTAASAVVRILLEGDFPGGRVELTYRFAVAPDGPIADLSITV
ncbi:nuclear transport factor 2 family protein [Nakamurella flavida]|uniref:Nuclear transport factor 2 family protein n=1 Tax=Nakamurella flavida TaxID=363630 RepID=A0A938YIF6_9ACTN|nr:nuclear transport factor 2 family protein [Nakamurella flavida]MBM9478280.1 nuclear transport factor 2 family protein [Nakamurella flavida]MDP9777549.1 ketosteroid isomerase-like protein [Nakamurella flavida]